MIYIEAPDEYDGTAPSVFLAGGITGCPDWQADAARCLAPLPVAVLNPRRRDFPIGDPTAATAQVDWEYRHLRRADVVVFWFPDSGPVPQPIALYELGAHAASGKPIAVGADPGYVRRTDVVLQLGHARPDVVVRDNILAVCGDAAGLLERLPPRAVVGPIDWPCHDWCRSKGCPGPGNAMCEHPPCDGTACTCGMAGTRAAFAAVVADRDGAEVRAERAAAEARSVREGVVTGGSVDIAPRGWDELAAMSPIDARCHRCGGAAVTRSPDGPRCAQHPPVAGEYGEVLRVGSRVLHVARDGWGVGVDWTPVPCRGPARCYCRSHSRVLPLGRG